MTARIYDFTEIRTAIEMLESVSSDGRLLALKNLCENNNGIWTIPEKPESYNPVFFEIALYGVPACATDPEQLAPNWLKAAHAILEGAA